MNKTLVIRFLISHSDNRQSKIQNRKWVRLFAVIIALTVCGARAEAQQPARTPRIGQIGLTIPPNVLARADKVIR